MWSPSRVQTAARVYPTLVFSFTWAAIGTAHRERRSNVRSAVPYSVLQACTDGRFCVAQQHWGSSFPAALGISPWYLWLGGAVFTWILLGFLASVYVKVLFPPKILKYDGPPIRKIFDNPDDLPINPWRKR